MTGGPARLDAATLEGLRELGGDEFLAELIATFLDEAPNLLAAIDTPLAESNVDEVRRAAHTLKSNAATFGAESFADLCRELEERARAGDLAGAGDLVERIGEEYVHVHEALDGVRRGAPA